MNPETGLHECSTCGATHKSDHWNTKAAQRKGWFFKRDGTAWCPEHVPEWVEDWRARQREKAMA